MATKYQLYSKGLINSVIHIFSNLFDDKTIKETVESKTTENDKRVWIEFNGSMRGEIIIITPKETLDKLVKKYNPKARGKKIESDYNDVLGEVANLIAGTLANQLQYYNHTVIPTPPEFEEDPIPMKTLFESVSLSFTSGFGHFDIEAYIRDK